MIKRLRYGNTNTFLIHGGEDNLLVDTGYAGTLSSFYREIKKHNIRLEEIGYVLATHYHPDHMGLISELMQQGVKLLLMDTQAEYVHYSDKIFARDKRLNYTPVNEKEAVLLKCEESRAFLRRMGIEGEIVATPSHSQDSISLILDDGACFVGDMEPIEYLRAYEDNAGLQKDWELILSFEPKVVFYGHANENRLIDEYCRSAKNMIKS